MSLSADPVRKLLGKHFVNAWMNTEGDAAAGGSFAHAPSDPAGTCIRGNGKQNLQMLVLTPDGRLLHALAGYADAKVLERELIYALKTWDLVQRSPEEFRAGVVTERAKDRRREPLREEFGDNELFAKHVRLSVNRALGLVAKRPLMPVAEYRTEMLGGSGRSFFGTSSGGRPKGRIGNVPDRLPGLLGESPEEKPPETPAD